MTSMDSTLGLVSPASDSPADMARPPCPGKVSLVSQARVDSQSSPGTDTKNLTASLWPWNESCAWDMEHSGVKVAGITLSAASAYTLTGPPGLLFSITSSIRLPDWDLVISGACRGTLMMTPLPVPSQSLLQLTCRAVIRTKEKPSLPVPGEKRHDVIQAHKWEVT